ncbi:MAG: hypothetical protein IPJ76_12050 [Flavobacteriales bacterium]|nr:MAG: hypothetical protein IPJ76_12050 [Flavobacteriales bacterium]
MRQRFIGRSAVAVFCISSTLAQDPNDGSPGGTDNRMKRVVPYPNIREADVLWHKRVWRTIDLREKMNHALYYPVEPINDRKSLFEVIQEAVLMEGSITAYDVGVVGQDDEFTKALSAKELQGDLRSG